MDDKIKSLRVELKSQLLEELKIETARMMEEKATQLHKKQDKIEFSLRGSSFQLQGNVRMTQGMNKGATMDYVNAVKYFLDSDSYSQVEPLLRAILNNCLPNLSKDEIIELKSIFIEMLSKIAERDKLGSFNNLSNELANKIMKETK